MTVFDDAHQQINQIAPDRVNSLTFHHITTKRQWHEIEERGGSKGSARNLKDRPASARPRMLDIISWNALHSGKVARDTACEWWPSCICQQSRDGGGLGCPGRCSEDRTRNRGHYRAAASLCRRSTCMHIWWVNFAPQAHHPCHS